MKNTLAKMLMMLIALTVFGDLAVAQSMYGRRLEQERRERRSGSGETNRVRGYLPQDLEDEVDRTQRRRPAPSRNDEVDDVENEQEESRERRPRSRARTRPQAEETGPSQIPYPGSQNNVQPARACYTRWGACPMGIAIPQGSYCTCTNYYGAFPGVAK